MKHFVWIGVLLIVSACVDHKTLFQKTVPKEDDIFARRFINSLREGRYEEADPMLDPAVAAQVGANGIARLHQILDHGEPISFETIGWNFLSLRPFDQSKPTTRTTNLSYQLQFRDAWVVANVVLTSTGQGNHVSGVNLQPIPDSLERLNRFTLTGKTAFYYAFFAMCILVPLFILITIVICVRSCVRRRWLWIVFILIGFIQFQLNWSTGDWNIQPIAASLLGFAYWRPGLYGPWILKFAIPVGAIVFLILQSRLRRKEQPWSLPTAPAPP